MVPSLLPSRHARIDVNDPARKILKAKRFAPITCLERLYY